jgi:hypothetical protein
MLLRLALPAIAARAIETEVGASYFVFRNARLEPAPNPLSVDQSSDWAPFIAATYRFNERLGLRVSYEFVDDVRSTAEFGSPPGDPPPPLPVVYWGHYRDDVHIVSAAPEFSWPLWPRWTFSLAPRLNWVASRGDVRYATNSALILLRAPRRRNDRGVTLGGSARFGWSLGPRSSVSLGYSYLDLEPSFDREGHVFSAVVSWRF